MIKSRRENAIVLDRRSKYYCMHVKVISYIGTKILVRIHDGFVYSFLAILDEQQVKPF